MNLSFITSRPDIFLNTCITAFMNHNTKPLTFILQTCLHPADNVYCIYSNAFNHNFTLDENTLKPKQTASKGIV